MSVGRAQTSNPLAQVSSVPSSQVSANVQTQGPSQAKPAAPISSPTPSQNTFDRAGTPGGSGSFPAVANRSSGQTGGVRSASLLGLQLSEAKGPLFFATAPQPQDQAAKLAPGQHTGFHHIREENGRFFLDTSDAVRLAVPPEKLKEMVENGKWSQDWWGGNSTTERNPPKRGEIANFDFIPDTAKSQLPGFLQDKIPSAIADTPLAKLNISIMKPEVTDLGGGRSVTTYRATLNPAGDNAGDGKGKIKETGDISGEMRLHVVNNGDGTSTFQLDWNGMAVEPKGPGGLLESFDPSVKSEGFGSGMTNALKKTFINVVGEGHNSTLRPAQGNDSGFARMAEKLGVGDTYQNQSIPFEQAHPKVAARVGL